MDDVTLAVPGLSEEQALERIISFAQRFGPLHIDLASHAAFPLVLTPDLLYRLWANFLPQIPWTTVSDILLSPLCREVGYELYEMDPSIRNVLLRELREESRFGETRLRELAQFLEEYIKLNLQSDDPDQRDLAEAQHLTALAHTEPEEAAREIASKLSDPSQLQGDELLRVATLTESLYKQLQDYSSLVHYARGVERLAHGDQQTASDLLNRAFEEKQDIEIAGVTLQRPAPPAEPVQAQVVETVPETTTPVVEEVAPPGTPKIFISYRRADSKYVVDRIRDRLTAALGDESVFRDLEDIPVGLDFRTMIESEIRGCNVMLVVIGPQWADITDAQGKKRLFDPGDFTRIEVEMGLAHPEVRVIPVVVMGTGMPDAEDLPESLHELLYRNAISIRNDPDFQNDVERLIDGIRKSLGVVEDIDRSYFEPETVLIPAGPFLMGSPPGEGIPAYETPQHEVNLPAYRIGKYPVTNVQYEQFVREGGSGVQPPQVWLGRGVQAGIEKQPVTGVSFYDALEYCRWLSQKTGRQYMLPNEAQWEKACRGSDGRMYPWGNTFDPNHCNQGKSQLALVDAYPAQGPYGCFDLVGNAQQWTCSLWGEDSIRPDRKYLYPWRNDRRNDPNASERILRVVRGSSFDAGAEYVRCSFRGAEAPTDNQIKFTTLGCGFRVVLSEVASDSISIGDISISGDVIGGDIRIGPTIGYTAEQVSDLLKQITTTLQPKPFDGRCPYKGLEVFGEEDAELFFGRERLVNELVGRIKESRTVFIIGPSGSGKSSLVRAGLIHALKLGAIKGSERWLYETMKPGREPLKDLALAFSRLKSPELADYFLAHSTETDILNKCADSVLSGRKDQRFLLFVDQFEEVFTQINNEEERVAFINILAHAGTIENGRVIMLFAMRSDFVSNCATYPALNEILSQQLMQIGAMQPEELVSAIALPARHVGLPVEDELIAQIINDMKGEPYALPLMQFALKDLFDAKQAEGGVIALTLKDYLQHGGIHKSLERHADATLAELSEREQELARSIFSGLIEIGRGTQDTKRTAFFDELIPANANPDDVLAVVQKLADARLVTTDEQAGKDTVTISHEKLIDAWPWLRKLVNENRDVIAIQNEIATNAREWQETSSRVAPAGIARLESRQATALLQKLKSELQVEIVQDWGDEKGAWQSGTWTIANLERLQRTLDLMASLMGGSEAFIRTLGGVSVQKSALGTHGGEALSHRVSFSTMGTFSAWTVVHEFAHAWDANYQWSLSRELERYTGGSTSTVRSLALRLTRNWDAGQDGPKNKPGRYGRLPGCNRAGYFYGDKPSGSNWNFNRVEDFADSVTMYVGWERDNDLSQQARNRILRYRLPNRTRDAFGVEDNWADYNKYFYPESGDYTKTKRWQFMDELFKGKISVSR
jgi:formylglycine-generating enzyme required for sulfatase activity